MNSEELEPEHLLATQLTNIISNITKSVIEIIPQVFLNDKKLLTKLKKKCEETGKEEVDFDLIFSVFEDSPELSIAELDRAIERLPLSVRLAINSALGIASAILRLKPEWRNELIEKKEQLILGYLRYNNDPDFVALAECLKSHEKCLKVLSDWIVSKLI